MTFTSLHQAIGAQPGPITSKMIDDLIAQGVQEGEGLDFKKKLPSQKELASSDFPKDVAAFANASGGTLVYGVDETDRVATSRVSLGEISESYERTLRQVAVSSIHPPVFGLDVTTVGTSDDCALVVTIPPSLERPHMVYRGEYFGAPVRNHADTVWMRERQIEQMYRSRFESRRQADDAIDQLYQETVSGRSIHEHAWLVMVAVPRLPRAGTPVERSAIQTIAESACHTFPDVRTATKVLSSVPRPHPLNWVDRGNPRRGMRRWVLRNARKPEHDRRLEAWIAILDNGPLTLAMSIGSHDRPYTRGIVAPGHEVYGRTVECVVAEFVALLAELSRVTGPHGEYDLLLGIEWAGPEPLVFATFDSEAFRDITDSIPLPRFTRVRASLRPDVPDDDLRQQVCAIALDVVNQGGVQNLELLSPSGPLGRKLNKSRWVWG